MDNSAKLLSEEKEELFLDLDKMSFLENTFNFYETRSNQNVLKSFETLNPAKSEKMFKGYLERLDDQILMRIYLACKKYRIVAIFTSSKPCSLEIREQLINREIELFQACEKFNDDKKNGGLIGPLYKNQLPQWLRKEIGNMDPKMPSKPIKVDGNYCIATVASVINY